MKHRYLSVMVRIDGEWPEGSVDLSDAINRLLVPLWATHHAEVVMGYQPTRKPKFTRCLSKAHVDES